MKFLYTICGTQFQVSDEDEIFLAGFNWKLDGKYIRGSGGRFSNQLLHRIIAKRAGLDLSNQIDHKDRNPLNNRRNNLRPATHSQNNMNSGIFRNNTSGVTGVRRHRNKWRSQINVKGKYIHLGVFETLEEASAVRRKAEIKYFGDFAP